MNDGRNANSEAATIRKGLVTIVIVLTTVFGLPMLLLWQSAPTFDSRLFGDWYAVTGMIWRFHPDGTLEMIPTKPVVGPAPWRLQRWHTEADGLVIGGRTSTGTQLIHWLRRKQGAAKPTFQIAELTGSTLRLRRTVMPPPGPLSHAIRPEEVLSRIPVARK